MSLVDGDISVSSGDCDPTAEAPSAKLLVVSHMLPIFMVCVCNLEHACEQAAVSYRGADPTVAASTACLLGLLCAHALMTGLAGGP